MSNRRRSVEGLPSYGNVSPYVRIVFAYIVVPLKEAQDLQAVRSIVVAGLSVEVYHRVRSMKHVSEMLH